MSRFSIEICLSVPKQFVGESFCAVFLNFPLAKKFIVKREVGEYQDYRSKIFCLPVLKVLLKESPRVPLSSSIEKSYG